MIKLRRRPLRTRDRTLLEVWQRRLDGVPPYDRRIGDAWSTFTDKSPLRQRIARWLTYQCISRCVYCEHDGFETIDHYYPKKQFPAATFAWWNFSATCWTCNRNKGQPLEFHHSQPMIINPLDEVPAEFFYFDPQSGFILPALQLDKASDEYVRAEYTIVKLKLNERGLPKKRKLAADDLRRALKTYKSTAGNRAAEKALMAAFRECNELRAILHEIMTNPPPADKPLVDYCLQNSPRVLTFLQAIGWL